MKTLPSIPNTPTADLTRIDEMRRAMRRQALEHLAEADRLDALHAAVTGDMAVMPKNTSKSNSDMGLTIHEVFSITMTPTTCSPGWTLLDLCILPLRPH